jgi:hypothetical protein
MHITCVDIVYGMLADVQHISNAFANAGMSSGPALEMEISSGMEHMHAVNLEIPTGFFRILSTEADTYLLLSTYLVVFMWEACDHFTTAAGLIHIALIHIVLCVSTLQPL